MSVKNLIASIIDMSGMDISLQSGGEISIKLTRGPVTYLSESEMIDLLKRSYRGARVFELDKAIAVLSRKAASETYCWELGGVAYALENRN